MKKTLFIGSTVLDIVVNVDHLPTLMEDINTNQVSVSLGGCAYNASNILHQLELPYLLVSPIGTGFFASNVERLLREENKKPFIQLESEDNGCCICLVDKNGERTFLSHHGAEYLFKKDWLHEMNLEEIDYVYICGLEVEDQAGDEIIEYLQTLRGIQIVFAPGARIMHIQQERMDKIMSLHPILHLNKEEAIRYTHQATIEDALKKLFEITQEVVIITDGAFGAYAQTQKGTIFVESVPTQVEDTIGAGDSHIGGILAGLKMGKNIEESLKLANIISSKVVGIKGANIKQDQIKEII